MKKHIVISALLLLFAIAFYPQSASAVEGSFSIFDLKNPARYYESEYIQLWFNTPTPHDPYKATYYIVNEKTKKKTRLGSFDLSERMNAGFSSGFPIKQRKGTYHYLTILQSGKEKYEFKTPTIEVLPKSRASKPRIKDFHIEFGPSQNYTYYGEGDYRLAITSELENNLSSLYGTATIKCSKPLTLYSKMGDLECNKKKQSLSASSKISEVYGVYSEDLEKDIVLEVEFKLLDTNMKRIDTAKEKVMLSAN